jgi:uncharacterized protein
MTRVLGVFAKWPRPGFVKTRLAAVLGAEKAARVAAAFLNDTLNRLAEGEPATRRVVAFTPDEMSRDFADLVSGRYALRPQGEGDLGARMERFLTAEFAAGAERVILVGADSPTLPVDLVTRAFAELEHADIVLGPAADGGYYLIGFRRHIPSVFAGVSWGTNRVFEETIARLPADVRLAQLPPWYDVDTPDDWQLLRYHVAGLRSAGVDPGIPHTEALLREDTA